MRSSTSSLSTALARSSRDLARMLERRRLVVGRGLGRGLGQVLLGRLHRAAGADQVLLERDAGVAQPGRDRRQGVGRAAVLGLVAPRAAELGLGDGPARPAAIRSSRRVELLLEQRRGPSPRRRRPRRRRSPSRWVDGVAPGGRRPACRCGGLEVGEQRVGGEGRGGLADGRLAVAERRPGLLAVAGLLRRRAALVSAITRLLVADERLEVGPAGGQPLARPCAARWRSATSPARAALP